MKIIYYGHACFGVEIKEINLLFDPFISPNSLASNIAINEIKADYVFVSHGHEDHMTDAIAIAKNNDAIIVSNFEIINWFKAKGIEKGHPMNIGGSWKFDFGKVTFFNALHSSNMPDGSTGGNPGSFIVETDEACFYFAGDTGLFCDMKLLAEFKKIDFAMLPIGDNFTMGIDDAILAADFINCKKIIGMHYDTFPYIVIDKKIALEKFNNALKELILLNIGASLTL